MLVLDVCDIRLPLALALNTRKNFKVSFEKTKQNKKTKNCNYLFARKETIHTVPRPPPLLKRIPVDAYVHCKPV